MKLFALKIACALVMAVLVVFTIVSTSDYVFRQTQIGSSVMDAMLEWASTGNHWMILSAVSIGLMIYSFYRVIPLIGRRLQNRIWTWQLESGRIALFLAFAVGIWVAFGRTFHH
jgi:hypothetical protein